MTLNAKQNIQYTKKGIPRKPIKPRKPPKPSAPEKNITERVYLYDEIDDCSLSLQELMDQIPDSVSYNGVHIELYRSEGAIGYEWGDSYHRLNIFYLKKMPNEDYERQLAKYKRKLKLYKAKLENWEEKMAQYEAQLIAYEEWSEKERVPLIQKEISKLKEELERLGK